MRWFRRKRDDRFDQNDEARRLIIDDVRQRFGVGLPGSFQQQATAVTEALTGPDGVGAAGGIVREFADSAHAEIQRLAAELSRQVGYRFQVDRTNYRPMWREAQPDLRWPLFNLPCGLFPYIHVAGALRAISNQVKLTTDQDRLHGHLFEILDLTVAGWEFASVRVDTDGAALAGQLIGTARDVRMTMSKEPPIPLPIRELMRRNNIIDVYAPDAHRIVGGFNPGREMREVLLA
ncbi:hypothetical protein GCM10010172_72920 [Paractinoplanes ferrugineus]|uniref:Uncharacterized protein n=1 Tax=Paractinoplanes ferrugineus TaxID=113564 RepID=A0A919MDA4_9ACTN|nr:hypothetical protein [Actinoplanes ferrugineus]GIE11553.1 hypothetical protein Afe05nite_33930 [Actinoplanes ferrugineus]